VSKRDWLRLTPDLTIRWATGSDNFVYSSLWDFKSKILRHGTFPLYFPFREEDVLRIFIALKNPSPWPGFEPATFGSSGQHTNHYTAKATIPTSPVCNRSQLVQLVQTPEEKFCEISSALLEGHSSGIFIADFSYSEFCLHLFLKLEEM
jgi:hypothetical protein